MGLFNFGKSKRYFSKEAFNENFSDEFATAIQVYEQMLESGFKENALAEFDFTFGSDTKEKVNDLSNFLTEKYNYTLKPCVKQNKIWTLEGSAPKIPFDEDGLLYWAIDLYCKGFEFDCILSGYGSLTDPGELSFLNLDNDNSDTYFKKGLSKIDNRNFGEAIIYFGVAIQIDPKNHEAYQARGYCKDELYTFKTAREDYDKAIEINPNYIDALLLRGANLDDANEFDAAITDYNKVIELDPENANAYFNRGNSKFSLADKNGACEDWKKAKLLGSEDAQACIDDECK
jgi:tetratricopeptide (TPR) repeat protein